MRTLRRGYVDIAGGQVHFIEADGVGPPIVFLHQTASSARSYAPLLAELKLPHRRVALDTPGFGGSFDPSGWPSLADYAAQIAEAIAALDIRRFHLFGHHTGASLAIEIAAAMPQRTRSVTLAGPVFMTAQEREDFAAAYDKPITPQRDGAHLMVNWRYAAGHNPSCSVEILQDAVVDLLRAWKGRPQAYLAVARHDTAARARQVQAPVLLLTSPGDFFHGDFPRAREVFPGASEAVVGGDNFQATADAPGVARALEAFIGRIEAAA